MHETRIFCDMGNIMINAWTGDKPGAQADSSRSLPEHRDGLIKPIRR